MKLRMKLFGEGGDVEIEDVSSGGEFEFSLVCLVVMVDEFLEDEIDDRKCGWLWVNFDEVFGEEDLKLFFRDEFVVVLYSSVDNILE